MRHLLPLLTLVTLALPVVPAAAEGSIRISTGDDGNAFTSGSGSMAAPSAFDDSGDLVAFESLAPFSPDDVNGAADIFVRMIGDGKNSLVSARPDGIAGNNASTSPSMSADGRFVAFQSHASDLIEADTNAAQDIFIRDLGSASLVRVAAAGVEPNGTSSAPSMSRDGQVVAFCSTASNLVQGDDNGIADLFVAASSGQQIQRIDPVDEPAGGCARTAINADGSIVAFSSLVGGESGVTAQVYRHDRQSGETVRVSSSGGSPGNAGSGLLGLSMSDDGSVVAFDSNASDLVSDDENDVSDVFVWDSSSDEITRVSRNATGTEGNRASGSLGVALSGDGSWVAFGSEADNLLEGDANFAADIFRVERSTGAVTLVSADPSGNAANGPSYSPVMNRDGGTVVFASLAFNIYFGDRNKNPDVFLRTGDFPETAGSGTPASPTTPGDPAFDVPSGDDGGIPSIVTIAVVALLLAGGLVGGWYLLGRQPKA
jgi:Tol biopolymer transport system component